jgi:ABC-type Fe3+/spermidine/putrescine transport system ATPase subunit
MEMSARPEASVSVRNVTKTFDKVSALKDVSLDVGKGEFISFVGPSGCGKTTLLASSPGLERPTSGRSRSAARTSARSLRISETSVSYSRTTRCFPTRRSPRTSTSGCGIERACRRRSAGERSTKALDLVRLRDYGRRRPSELSGGQQQRIALARAVVTRPEVLLLDEPLSNLDAKLRDEMRVELTELHRKLGLTFVYVTHDQAEALSMSDRVAVLRSGQVDQVGSPQDIFERPDSIHVAAFIGQGNLLAGIAGERSEGCSRSALAMARCCTPSPRRACSRLARAAADPAKRRDDPRSAEAARRDSRSVIAGASARFCTRAAHRRPRRACRWRTRTRGKAGPPKRTRRHRRRGFLSILPTGTWVLADDQGE